MNVLLARRNLSHRPGRTALLFAGYGIGVTVMIVLLSIGEALLIQGRDERLVGGGDVTVLPEGLDVEVMKTGGLGGLFFSIDHARFVYHQLLAAPRLRGSVAAVAPQIDGKLVYLRVAGREYAVRANGGVPSADRSVGAAPPVAVGRWEDDSDDRRWMRPTLAELRHDIDHFHAPPAGMPNPESWAEWHYFNVISADGRRWAFISFIVAGDVTGATPKGKWGGEVLVTLREQGGRSRRFSALVPPRDVRFSTATADVRLGESSVRVLPDGRYSVVARAREESTGMPLRLSLVVTPAAGAYFPGASISSEGLISGYVVPALRADAAGAICVASACDRYQDAQSYHDHNWGGWRGVTWEWGAARAGAYTVLYGRVDAPEGEGQASDPLFVYVTDSLGFLAVFRPRQIAYEDSRTIVVRGRRLRVPGRASMADVRGGDTLRIELEVEDAIGTDTRLPLVERGESALARALPRPYFVQMKGTAHLTGRVNGDPIDGRGTGFFETYR